MTTVINTIKVGISKSTLLWFGFFAILGIGFLSYLDSNSWERSPSMLSELPAALFPATEDKTGDAKGPTELGQASESANPNENDTEMARPEGKYLEEAAKGEGVTHLARKALKEYLKDNSPSFEVTPEHKIYIEDYLAKKTSEKGLKLGEQIEFSQDLIQSALQAAEKLSPIQLENLTQFSHLVPSLNN